MEPTKDFDRYSGIIKEYYDGLFSKLFNGLSEKPLARYLVIPSTAPEYVLSLQKENNEYILKYQVCSENYWFAVFRQKVTINSKSIAIDKDLALLLQGLFKVSTSKIAKSNQKRSTNRNGATYYFSTYKENRGIITGEKWTPEANSKIQRLVVLCEKYIVYIKKGKGKKKLRKETLELIRELKE